MLDNNLSERNILEEAIKRALNQLYKNDSYLLEHNLHEQCIAFRFGGYLLEELKHTIYSEYDLDAEYDHNLHEKKCLPSWSNGARPDFIIHKRGANYGSNICVIELKKGEDGSITTDDEKKIREFMNCSPYFYKYGATILLSPNKPQLKWV